jgi:hypothetical protein
MICGRLSRAAGSAHSTPRSRSMHSGATGTEEGAVHSPRRICAQRRHGTRGVVVVVVGSFLMSEACPGGEKRLTRVRAREEGAVLGTGRRGW